MTIKLSVSDHDQGTRIDRFINYHTGITQSAICKMIRHQRIMVDNIAVHKPSYRLQPNSHIVVKDTQPKQVETKNINSIRANITNTAPLSVITNVKNSYIYEDDDIIVINKPYGLATQSGGSLKYSLDDIMRQLHGNDIKIVHRLDKETSGLLLLAKNRLAAAKISQAFKEQDVQKVYLAILHPIPQNDSGTIQSYNHKISGSMNRYKAAECRINVDDKIAISTYKVLKRDMERQIALVQFEPQTGRTHQIRLHALQLNCPIVGDYRYGGNLSLSDKLQLLAYKITIPNFRHRSKKSDKMQTKDFTFTCPEVPSFFLLQP
jgi:23S rRNA pseudouridine955/2504/2580 synthase